MPMVRPMLQRDVLCSPLSEPQPGGQPAAGRRVLVVEDNADAADTLALLLELMGHEARTASDGAQALQVAPGFRPEVVLLDIGLPKMNGYEVCRRMREQPWGREAFIVALTGWGQADDLRQASEAGFDRHLVKPVEEGVLERLLAEMR
jgi:CheY-like chemotaxis protein